jgi:hypothetical protein
MIIWHKTHIIPLYDLIGEILQDVQATGRSSFTTADPIPLDPRLIALDTSNSSASVSLALIVALKPAYNKSKKHARIKEGDDMDKKALAAKKVNIRIAISGLTIELTLTRRLKETYLTNQQKAVQLLEKEYRARLHIIVFIQACAFFQDKGNIGTFITLIDSETRDRFLEISIGTELIN